MQIYEEPLVASLAFSSSLWVDPVLPATKKLAPEQVHVTQDVSTSRRESGAKDGHDQDQDTPGKNERSAYGAKVTSWMLCDDLALLAGELLYIQTF